MVVVVSGGVGGVRVGVGVSESLKKENSQQK